MQRKSIHLFFICVFLLAGCQEDTKIPAGFYRYDQTQLTEELNELTFEPELPPFLPIQVEFLITDHYTIETTDSEAIDISFYSQQNDILSFQATSGDFASGLEGENVTIKDNISGEYEDNQFAKTLYWKEEEIAYRIRFRSGVVSSEDVSNAVTKNDLIEMAKAI